MATKVCTKCGEELPANTTYFRKDKKGKYGLAYECKMCTQMKDFRRYLKDPERPKRYSREYAKDETVKYKKRVAQLKYEYKITEEDVMIMMDKQKGICPVCNRSLDHHEPRPHYVVDHCHTTGEVRGLLCYLCNIGLGYFEDNTKSLERAREYLDGATYSRTI